MRFDASRSRQQSTTPTSTSHHPSSPRADPLYLRTIQTVQNILRIRWSYYVAVPLISPTRRRSGLWSPTRRLRTRTLEEVPNESNPSAPPSPHQVSWTWAVEVAGFDIRKLVNCLAVRSPHPHLPGSTSNRHRLQVSEVRFLGRSISLLEKVRTYLTRCLDVSQSREAASKIDQMAGSPLKQLPHLWIEYLTLKNLTNVLFD